MVRTMRKVPRESKPVGSKHKDSARLSILRKGSSGSTSLNAKGVADQNDDSADESEELPSMEDVLNKRREGKAGVAKEDDTAGDVEGLSPVAEDDEEEGEDDGDENGDEVAATDEVEYGDDAAESGGEEESSEPSETQDQEAVSVEDEDEDGEDDDHGGSSDIEGTDTAGPTETISKRPPKKGKRAVPAWDEPTDTKRMLDLLEQLAMRDHYINVPKHGWRNNAFGVVAEQMGKDAKLCSNRYLKLKYKYLEVMKLLNLGLGLSWDDESNEVYGSDKAWSKVKDPALAKLRGRKFLYKEEFDNLNTVLNFVPAPKKSTEKRNAGASLKAAIVHHREGRDINAAAKGDQTDEDGNHEAAATEDRANGGRTSEDDYAQSDVELASSSKTASDARNNPTTEVAKPLATYERRSDTNWFDSASIHELVRLLVEYVKDDYYIAAICKTWKNGVFKEIAAKTAKHQQLCQSKYMALRDVYVEIDRLLKSDLGFKWDPEKNEVVGSNETWAKVNDPNLTRRRRRKFLFKEEFDKLAEKLDLEPRQYAKKKSSKSIRTSARISGSRPTYTEPPDEVEESVDGEEDIESAVPDEVVKQPSKKRLYSDTYSKQQSVERDDHIESHASDESGEPPRKRRLLSDTYEKRREAFYIAARTMSTKRDELKTIVDAQLAVHKEQMAALQAHHVVEHKLALRLEECHLKDTLRRDTLEGLRSTAHARLQHEIYLTPSGKLAIIRTLPNLSSKADGYLGVMFLDPVIRKLWLKGELERLCPGQVGDYFIEEADSSAYQVKDSLTKEYDEVEDLSALTLVEPDYEVDADAATSAQSVCENDDSGIGIHYKGDGCSSDAACEKDASNEPDPREPYSTKSDEQKGESDE